MAGMRQGNKICFLTNVYRDPFETRIFYREARTLAANGYEVVFIVQHAKPEIVDGVRIIPLPIPVNRFDRMTRLVLILFWLAFRERAVVYHLHSPELIPVGIVLKVLGAKVIYDVHEAFGEKIFTKNWIKPWLRPAVSAAFVRFEKIVSRCFDHIIAADSFVASQFSGHKSVTVIANFPVIALIKKASSLGATAGDNSDKTIAVYAGVITKERGLFQMLEAVKLLRDLNLNVELHLMGRCEMPEFEAAIKEVPEAKYFGILSFEDMLARLKSASIGLVLFQPVRAYLYSGENTNKLFEYMACGLPIIGSNFPRLREFIEGNRCGVCVDPTSPKEIAKALQLLHENRDLKVEMGGNGQRAVLREYNWELESSKLLHIYDRLVRRNN